ncbi:MAG TPA: serine/threonine-protein kinase [Candidatus Acidoferrales bacterium]|nr:serine/threonine-protein kinase [Candidatus Acidoferrales bacterium]
MDTGAPAPRKWGHLEKLRRIGQGVFGEVYRAWDALLEREVALKLYREAREWLDQWARFGLQEARSLARIQHPNVVTVYGVDYRRRRLGVWMEYIQGCTLEALLHERGPLSAGEAARIGIDLCSAVASVHERGILHRDIQSKNVMREDSGRIVLMDFGLSQDLRPLRKDSAPRVCGTPLYMAPEILRCETASVQSDIYSIGILLYRLVTGCFPVRADTLREVRLRYQRGETVPLRLRRRDLPESYLCAVERALSPEPEGRFATACEMGEGLRASCGTASAGWA